VNARGQPGQTAQLRRNRATVHVPSAPALEFLAHAEISYGSTVNRRLRSSQVTLDNYLSTLAIRGPAWDDARASFPSVDGCSLKYV